MTNQEQLITITRSLFNKYEWLNRLEMEEKLHDYTPSEVHCIEYIEKLDQPNVTKLANALYMTRGAISKLTNKLMAKKLIESYRKPTNKKEIFFKLTKQGKDVFDIHEALHQKFQKRDQVVFDQLTETQLTTLVTFIKIYDEHINKEIKNLDKKD